MVPARTCHQCVSKRSDQALSLDQNKGSLRAAFFTLMAACAELASAGGISDFYIYLCLLSFNALIGNHDAHGKNFSLLYGARSSVLAPFYDLLSTAIYPTLTSKMAMKIGSKYKFSELEARHWEQFAEEAGLAKAATRKRLQQLANELPAAARKLQAAPPHGFAGNAVVTQIVQLIEQRCTLTLRRLV